MTDDHRERFNNLARKFDIHEDSVGKLENIRCTSVVALTHLTGEEVDRILTEYFDFEVIGQRSCIRGAIQFLKDLPTSDFNTPIKDESDSVIDHKARFHDLCLKFDIRDSTRDVLNRHSCNSIPALQFLHKEDEELLLVGSIKDIGQKSALRRLISSLKSVTTQTTVEPSSEDDDQSIKNAHCKLGHDLHTNIHPKDFHLILNAAKLFISNADIGACDNMIDVFNFLCERGVIEIGSNQTLYTIFDISGCTSLKRFVQEGEDRIASMKRRISIEEYKNLQSPTSCRTATQETVPLEEMSLCSPPSEAVEKMSLSPPPSQTGEQISPSPLSREENSHERYEQKGACASLPVGINPALQVKPATPPHHSINTCESFSADVASSTAQGKQQERYTEMLYPSSHLDPQQMYTETVHQQSSCPGSLLSFSETNRISPVDQQPSYYTDSLLMFSETNRISPVDQQPSCPDYLPVFGETNRNSPVYQQSTGPDSFPVFSETNRNSPVDQQPSGPDSLLVFSETNRKSPVDQQPPSPDSLPVFSETNKKSPVDQQPPSPDSLPVFSETNRKPPVDQQPSCPDSLSMIGETNRNFPVDQQPSRPDSLLAFSKTNKKSPVDQQPSSPEQYSYSQNISEIRKCIRTCLNKETDSGEYEDGDTCSAPHMEYTKSDPIDIKREISGLSKWLRSQLQMHKDTDK